MKYFNGYKVRTVVAIVAKFVEAVFEILIPLFMARLIDVGIIQNNLSVVYSSVFWMVVLTILGYSSSLVCQINASIISQTIGGRIRSDLFKHELALASEDINEFSSATLTNRLTSDVIYIQDMVARVIRLGIRAPFLIIGTIGALIYIDAKLAVIMLISIPIFTLVIAFFMWITMQAHSKATSNLDRLLERVSEILSGSRIIRAFSKQDLTDKVFDKQNDELYESQKKVVFLSSLSSPFTTLIMNFLLIILVYVSGMQINVGSMSQGEVMAVINYCSQLLITLIVSMNLIMIIARGANSVKRVSLILKRDVSENSGTISSIDEINLSLKDVTFSFKDEKRKVLNEINFDLKAGDTVGIIGLTGSGKSTLLRLITRLFDHRSGSILINGTDISNYDTSVLRDSIGYVPQVSEFIAGSIEDNIRMGKNVDAKAALIDAQGSDILSKGLEYKIEEGAKNLSGGQKQRINIARALAKSPKLLLLDDSFSALDALTTSNLQKVLKTKYTDTTKIITSQRINAIKDADLILVMDHGQIVDQGSHASLLESNEIYQTIDKLQKDGGIS